MATAFVGVGIVACVETVGAGIIGSGADVISTVGALTDG